MITLLSHLFIKNRDDVTNPSVCARNAWEAKAPSANAASDNVPFSMSAGSPAGTESASAMSGREGRCCER